MPDKPLSSNDNAHAAAERSRTAQESRLLSLEEGNTIISDVLDFMSEGFVLFDAVDRLVFCNETYRGFYSKVADLLVPGPRSRPLSERASSVASSREASIATRNW